MNEHISKLVEDFWAENPELKNKIFQAWYNKHDLPAELNADGKKAVGDFIGKVAILAAKKAWAIP